MKKKVQKMLNGFYEESDRGEQNIAECKNLYDLVKNYSIVLKIWKMNICNYYAKWEKLKVN